MLEKEMQIDAVLWADVGMDFPEMAPHIAKLDELLYRERGLHITTLRHPKGGEYLTFEVPMQQERAIQKRLTNHQPATGYGWPGPHIRWCTKELKIHLLNRESRRISQGKVVVQHIGIAE